jgi:hypothetical protein
MTRRLIFVVMVVLLFVVAAMIVVTILDFIPWGIRRYLGYVIAPVAVLWLLWSWFKRHAKQRGDQNELDVLEETVQEHERGRHDNTEYEKSTTFAQCARVRHSSPAVDRNAESRIARRFAGAIVRAHASTSVGTRSYRP